MKTTKQIVIEGEFKTANEYIAAANRNRFVSAKIKADETARAQYAAIQSGVKSVTKYPVKVRFTWYRKTKRTDPDNISFAQKFILDGLVLAGVITDDAWNYISRIEHRFELCDNPCVVIDIMER